MNYENLTIEDLINNATEIMYQIDNKEKWRNQIIAEHVRDGNMDAATEYAKANGCPLRDLVALLQRHRIKIEVTE